MNRILSITTIVWLLIMIFSPVRPIVQEQLDIREGMAWFYQQTILILTPYIAMTFLWLNIKMRCVKEKYFVYSLPFVMLGFLGLDLYNDLVKTISGNGSYLTIGSAYLMIIVIARFNKKNYLHGLAWGAIVAFATLYLWEVVYQLLIYTKAHFTIRDNITFFMSALYSLPFFIMLFKQRTINKKVFLFGIILFAITFMIWGLDGFKTGVYYDNGKWLYHSPDNPLISYWGYGLTRINKIAFGIMLAGINLGGFGWRTMVDANVAVT